LLDALQQSAEPRFAAVAAKAVKEVAYHRRLASDWVVRLGDGTAESRARMAAALDWMWRFVDELFEMDDVEDALVTSNVAVDKRALRAPWDERIAATLLEATLEAPAPRRAITGGRRGRHSENLGHILSEMQFLPRSYPGAQW
jgi:ring-1,2-phenylacetyl-CoA epoxidase subunit PaaC